MIETRIARILSPTKVVLAAGKQDGVKEGMLFVIYKLGEMIKDPDTHEELGRLEFVKGKVKVIHTQERISLAITLSRQVKRNLSAIGAAAAAFEYSETIYEKLPVGEVMATEVDDVVREGDFARAEELVLSGAD